MEMLRVYHPKLGELEVDVTIADWGARSTWLTPADPVEIQPEVVRFVDRAPTRDVPYSRLRIRTQNEVFDLCSEAAQCL